jgi:hypothetical protein
MNGRFTRPVRAAAQLLGVAEEFVEHLFTSARIVVALEESFAGVWDARETFLFTVNQCLRFCPNVAVYLPTGTIGLIDHCNQIASAIYSAEHTVNTAGREDFSRADAVINIGSQILFGLPSTTVNSTGWVARVSSGNGNSPSLTWMRSSPNAVGAHAAACLGASQAFLYLLNAPRISDPLEISLFSYQTGKPGSLESGPSLPRQVSIDAWLIGCGGVSNGWAYTIKSLPVVGTLTAVDRQSLRIENFGPYVAAGHEYLTKPKVHLIRDLLHPSVTVTPYADEWEFFKIRLKYGLSIPRLIVGGVDNVMTRHSIQRLWPKHLIDMAAGGLTSQVLVKEADREGLCLLRALKAPSDEVQYAERLSSQTGLGMDRIVNGPTETISQEDVASAPTEMKDELESARQRGELVCGYIMRHNLSFETDDDEFAPSVPFVTSLSGVVGAAETMKYLMGSSVSRSLHFQYSFQSGRGRALTMQCSRDCECASHVIAA